MQSRAARVGWVVLVLWTLLASLAHATPPRQARLRIELLGSETPRKPDEDVTFPIAIRALASVPASGLRVILAPYNGQMTTVPLPAMSAGELRRVNVTLPLRSVGDFTIVCTAEIAQLDAVVQVRPKSVTVVSSRDHERASIAVQHEKLNNPRFQAQGGGPLDGLKTAIVAEKRAYAAREPMSFHLSISNVGPRPLTIADARLGSSEMSVWLDGPTVNRHGLGKTYPVTDPFPDGVLHLGPGQRWDGKIVVDDPHDLEDIATWPGGSFTYRFIYRCLNPPASGQSLENLWQGNLIAGDGPQHRVTIVGGGAPAFDAGAPVDAASPDAGSPAPIVADAATDGGATHRGGRWRCSLAYPSSVPGGDYGVVAIAIAFAARRRPRAPNRLNPVGFPRV